ncbi:MAG: NADH-quinone oxidoreductase subunit I [Streptosporangiaceae bacterium]|nr:NADH-quinone oxidoreductase subunit I [Streptosporangiaceae bacterium]
MTSAAHDEPWEEPLDPTARGVPGDGRRAARWLPRLLPRGTDVPEDLRAHVARYGGPPYRGAAQLLVGDVRAAGLTGRGGAAFPVHRKLAAVLDAARRSRYSRPVVVANGAESEPASEKDATLLWLAPHLVLDGLQLAAEAVGADQAILCVHAHRGGDVGIALRRALAERDGAQIDKVPVELAEAPPRFLAGQETALVNRLGGGPALPTFVPPRVTERGLGNAPTLVQNVETLAHLALIARYGPRWFRAAGTELEPGSMLCTLRRADGVSRITEVPLGTPLCDLLGGRDVEGTVLVGGYHGTWIPAGKAAALTLDSQSLRGAGASPGAGILITLPPTACGLAETARVARYLALESAGQCGPCLNGLPRIAGALDELAGPRPRRRTVEDVQRWAGLVTGRGACHHPDGTARFVRSALIAFAGELGLHERGRCSATSRKWFLPVPADPARTEEDWM